MTYIIKTTRKEEKFINAYFGAVAFTERNARKYGMLCDVWEREQIIECLAFMAYCRCYLSDDNIEQAGHDFWLSRNKHGAGFCDRDSTSYKEHIRDSLQRKAEQFGESDVYYDEVTE